MSKIKSILRSMIQEGFVDETGKTAELPKLDSNATQNTATALPNIGTPSVTQNSQKQNLSQEKPEGEEPKENEEKVESKPWLKELEAANAGMMLAEYHMEKVNANKTESEDIDFEKLGAAHRIITDTRKALSEMYSMASKSEKREKVDNFHKELKSKLGQE